MSECVFVCLVWIKAPHHLHYVRHAWTCQEQRVAPVHACVRTPAVGRFVLLSESGTGEQGEHPKTRALFCFLTLSAR